MQHFHTFLIFICLFTSCNSDDQSNINSETPYKHNILFKGLEHPWGLDQLNNDSWVITERSGRLRHWENNTMFHVTGLPKSILAIGQGGLLDIVVFKEEGHISTLFFTASNKIDSVFSTALFKAKFNRKSHHLFDVENIYQATPLNKSGGHFGSRIVIDKYQYIYLGLGERQNKSLAQNNQNSSGCVVRLNSNGSIPPSNPFTHVDSILNEIWSFGHRNIQGMTIHPSTNEIWSHEHGPLGGDEINIIKKGANYGWPLATYGLNYDGSIVSDSTHINGTEQPVYYWTPSIAPCGMAIYSGKIFNQWKNQIFVGALAKQHVNRLSFSNNKIIEEERLFQNFGRFRAIKEGGDGFIYLLSEGNGGVFSVIEKE